MCNDCGADYSLKYYNGDVKNFLRSMARTSRYVHDNDGKRRIGLVKNSCVTPEFVIKLWDKQNGLCAVTGLPMTHVRGQGGKIWTNVSIDRIDPEGGYKPRNVRLVCKIVNMMKFRLTDTEFLHWCRLIANSLEKTLCDRSR